VIIYMITKKHLDDVYEWRNNLIDIRSSYVDDLSRLPSGDAISDTYQRIYAIDERITGIDGTLRLLGLPGKCVVDDRS